MITKLEQIIADGETLQESLNSALLENFSPYPMMGVFVQDISRTLQWESVHVLGGISEPVRDGTFCSYRDKTWKSVLVVNLPEDCPLSFPFSDKLSNVDIRFTDLEKLELPSMKKVVRLNLAHNRYLKSVSGFSQLPALRELDIRHTQLDNLDEIGKCIRLRKLNAGGLKLEDSYFLTSLSALSELNLSGCRISEFPNLKKLRNLKSLDLSGARLPGIIDTIFPDSIESISFANSSLS